MAVRKPLVVVNGQVQQLQSGDVIATYSIVQQTNDESTPLVIGTPVYNDVGDGVKKAKADNASTVELVGLVFDVSAVSGAPVNVLTSGVLKATTAQWDAIFGTTGGLTPKTKYFLSDATAGAGTATAPTANGSYVVEIGRAISTTELLLSAPFSTILL